MATLAVLAFAPLDQELPYTYVDDPRPRYRWPASFLSLLFLILAAMGLMPTRAPPALPRRHLAMSFNGVQYGTFATLLIVVTYLAVYVPTAVETRYTAPLYALLTPRDRTRGAARVGRRWVATVAPAGAYLRAVHVCLGRRAVALRVGGVSGSGSGLTSLQSGPLQAAPEFRFPHAVKSC